MFDIVCVTARKMCCEPLEDRIKGILHSGVGRVILREKDLSETEYIALAKRVLDKTYFDERVSLHFYPQACEELKHKYLHISVPILKQNKDIKSRVKVLGVSVHSLEEARLAQKLGADYITAGHIFATDCKKGVPPRGTEFLTCLCKNVEIPVYAIGGINKENIELIKNSGAAGACLMSSLMTCENVGNYIKQL